MHNEISLHNEDNDPCNPNMLDAALAYAQRGWSVFPVHTIVNGQCSCDNTTCASPGKHPRTTHGVQDAITDTSTIEQWWTQWRDANIGIRTGAVSGLVVLDVDPRHGGDASLEEWKALYGHDFLTTLISCTGGGGLHLFYAYPGQPVRNKVGLAPGLDIRADRGYILAPPSLHISGCRYGWDPAAHPDTMPLAPMPAWLRDLVTAPTIPRGLLPSPGEVEPRIPEGERNATLASLAGTMRRRGMTVEEIAAALLTVNARRCQPPLDPAEVCGIAVSISHYPAEASLIPQTLAGEILDVKHPTDWGNAQRLGARHGEDLHYCFPWRRWLHWDGTRWLLDDTGEVMRRAKDTIAQMYREALSLSDPDATKRLLEHARWSEFAPRLKAMIELAASEPGVPILPGDLDTDRWLLNVQNGTLDLRTGELREPRREDLITKLAPVLYDPDATCPQWDAFLTRIMDGNQSLISFLQRAVGYALTGDVREQVLIILWGTGRNGKSTFLNTLMAMLGPYAMKASPDLLVATRGDKHPTERADLCGKRFVAALETGEGQRFDEVFVKEATGGDPIPARRMREDFWTFWPTHKIFLATNHKPVIKGADVGIWRRIRLVPFDVTLPEGEQDKTLPTKLQAELPGILTWAVQGCLAWQREGLPLPDAVSRATATYREEMDTLGRFITECCMLVPTRFTKTEALYQAYLTWCNQNGEYQLSKAHFGMRLRNRGLTARREGNERGWEGIVLTSGPDFQDALIEQLKHSQDQQDTPAHGEHPRP